ncbi:hypothetical protein VDG1235_4866 [Verrucomicrobiia bacterium DG1235]|nr:hypothetical protein VDG1235_4866 [Verrucomicrobiae bacterium DG1235]
MLSLWLSKAGQHAEISSNGSGSAGLSRVFCLVIENAWALSGWKNQEAKKPANVNSQA